MDRKGKLYRVQGGALGDDATYGETSRKNVDNHGYLWLFDRLEPLPTEEYDGDRDRAHHYRSLATGAIAEWFDYEIQGSDQEGA